MSIIKVLEELDCYKFGRGERVKKKLLFVLLFFIYWHRMYENWTPSGYVEMKAPGVLQKLSGFSPWIPDHSVDICIITMNERRLVTRKADENFVQDLRSAFLDLESDFRNIAKLFQCHSNYCLSILPILRISLTKNGNDGLIVKEFITSRSQKGTNGVCDVGSLVVSYFESYCFVHKCVNFTVHPLVIGIPAIEFSGKDPFQGIEELYVVFFVNGCRTEIYNVKPGNLASSGFWMSINKYIGPQIPSRPLSQITFPQSLLILKLSKVFNKQKPFRKFIEFHMPSEIFSTKVVSNNIPFYKPINLLSFTHQMVNNNANSKWSCVTT
ncbi:hypothetical protein NQ317_002844 [Molorchus minor]|uniref:Uncharacterized protein n=1 Tax=Molorchus minor TaxID=1323400 RepID=A0ABQ9JXN2_9CUCU|nr:hypothetical protein NQ317_002844 [Molorchus minor]